MSAQLSLLEHITKLPNIHFSGESYNPLFDCKRLNAQQRRVYECMIDGQWRSLREIETITGDPQASISARLRCFNNDDYLRQFFIMESERELGKERSGCWRYRLLTRSGRQ